MNESEKRVEKTSPIERLAKPTSAKLIELSTPGKEYTRPIGVEEPRLPPVELVEEDEVTEENFESFLPNYTDDTPPHLNALALANGGELVDAAGYLSEAAQAEYDQPGPKPQACFVDSSAGI